MTKRVFLIETLIIFIELLDCEVGRKYKQTNKEDIYKNIYKMIGHMFTAKLV